MADPCAVYSLADNNILHEAGAITSQRQRAYGHPVVNFQRIADFWNIQLANKLSAPITARDVGLMMISVKLAREIHAPARDNLIDIAGYAQCIGSIPG